MKKPFFPDMSSIEDAVGGAVSFSLTGRKFRLSEVKKAIMVFAAAFLQSWFQSSGAQKYESLEEDLAKFLDDLSIVYGRDSVDQFLNAFVMKDSIKKVDALMSIGLGKRKKINQELFKFVTGKSFKEIPLRDIVNILEKNGVVLLQEDFTPWAGFLLGRNSEDVFLLGDKNKSVSVEWGSQYEPFKDKLFMSWYELTSGKYEIVLYLI